MSDFIEVDGQEYVSMERYRELSAYCQQLKADNERLRIIEDEFCDPDGQFQTALRELKRTGEEQAAIRDWWNSLLCRDKKSYTSGSRGVIYVIRDVDVTGYCKIGKSINPKGRFDRFAVSLPFKCELVATIQSGNIDRAEGNLHKLFADKRVRGEWFNLDKDDIEVIIGMKKRK